MIPFERDIYRAMLVQHLKEQAEREREEQDRMRALQAKLNSRAKRGN